MNSPKRPTQSVWYSIVVILVGMLAMTCVSLVVSDRAARQSERRWCEVIATLDDAYRSTPPQSPAGQQLARDIHQLRADFRCPTRS